MSEHPEGVPLRCPPFSPGLVAGAAGRDALAARLLRLDAALTTPEDCFGLELKRAWRALRTGEWRRDPALAQTDVGNRTRQARRG